MNGGISDALAKAQLEIKHPEKNKTVKVRTKSGQEYTFDYADYSAIVESLREPLSKNGISFCHYLEERSGKIVLVTRLNHSSGEFFESIFPMPQVSDPKDFGAAMTYGKRYCLSGLTGCVADDDADAEPEQVTEFKDRKPIPAPRAVSPIQPAVKESPRDRLLAALKVSKFGWKASDVKSFIVGEYGLDIAEDLTEPQLVKLIQAIEKQMTPDYGPEEDISTDWFPPSEIG